MNPIKSLRGMLNRIKYSIVYNSGAFGVPAGAHWWDDRGWFGGKEINNAYEACAIAYACISTQARDVANVPLLFLSDYDDPDSSVPDSDPVKQLFEQPNPALSTRQYIELCMIWRLLRGECFTIFDSELSPQMMWPGYDPLAFKERVLDLELVSWRYKHGRETEKFPAGLVMHDKMVNPYNPFRGLSPLNSAEKAVQIDTRGEMLTVNKINRGGERAMLFEQIMAGFTPDKIEQAKLTLRGRRIDSAKVPSDAIIPFGLKPIDPRFTESDIDILASQEPSEYKICAVYGMNPFLIGRGDSAKYDSSAGIIRLYWERQILPTLSALESTWDQHLVRRRGGNVYVRFDRSKIKALQEDELAKARVAAIYVSKGVPWAEANRRFNLGLDDSAIPGAEDTLVAATMIPATLAYQGPQAPLPVTVAASDNPTASSLSDLIAKGLKNTAVRIQRARRQARKEVDLTRKLQRIFGDYGKRATAIVNELYPDGVSTEALGTFRRRMKALISPLADDLVKAVDGPLRGAMHDGRVAIRELTSVELADYAEHVKQLEYDAELEQLIDDRLDYLRDIKAAQVLTDAMEAGEDLIREAAKHGHSAGRVARELRKNFDAERHQANRIARTELGTMYNTSRVKEITLQGFKKHKWITSYDEYVRGSDPMDKHNHKTSHNKVRKVGETFPSQLEYPMQSGGEAGNVINCRCETIPVP